MSCPGQEFGLDFALEDGRAQVVNAVFSDLVGRYREQYTRLYRDHRRITETLNAAGCELPRELRAAAELGLSAELDARLDGAVAMAGPGDGDPDAFAGVRATLQLARAQGFEVDTGRVTEVLTTAVTASARQAAALDGGSTARVAAWLALADELGVAVDLGRAQEHAWEAAQRVAAGRLGLDEVDAAVRLAAALGLSPTTWTVVSA